MAKKKQHQTETRDHDEDMKLLARSFFDYLTLLPSKRHEAGVWGIDPKWLLGRSGGKDDGALAREVLDVIGYVPEATCDTCGHPCEGVGEIDEQAIAYAIELWSSLGVYLEGRWNELHEIEEEHLSNCCEDDDEEEEEELTTCDFCGAEYDAEEEDHECEEGLEDDEDDEEEEDDETCAHCGSDLDSFGECDCEPEE